MDSYRCCKESEVISHLGNLKQKQNKTEKSYTIQCEPNTLIQMDHSILEEKWNNSGGSIDTNKENRLFRDTKFTCYNSKKWDPIKLAKPDDILSDKEVIAKLSNDGRTLFAKYKAKFIESGIAKDLKIPLQNKDDYCVSPFSAHKTYF